ncbi:conserved hypothetical protein [Pediculus humanus corporis]|uniref:Uncharacterized protein n=1 Tax=Pediculus humanus subsp. corporis TaxID=121224 RepID=E0VKJ8_PEDHC|nr:uncharacterized protein Phum_PHUM266160 [Pediculus humanus corporis]EEB13904.1 conserved hypothetical protein [Pediculus humanus corporis]
MRHHHKRGWKAAFQCPENLEIVIVHKVYQKPDFKLGGCFGDSYWSKTTITSSVTQRFHHTGRIFLHLEVLECKVLNRLMSSYFANQYMPDMRNGGVVPEGHPHQHYGAVPQGESDHSCNGGEIRQGIPPHHYGGPPTGGQPPQGMPYPRFPPYDRVDIRAAAYYQQQELGVDSVDTNSYGRPNSPSIGHMGGPPNGHQTPVVYSSCKLQAAGVQQNIVAGQVTPPLDVPQPLNNHNANHMNHQPHHHLQMQHHNHMKQEYQQHEHMLYQQQQQQQQQPGPQHQLAAHQQGPGPQGSQGPQGQQSNNNSSNLPSPLYPWMRSHPMSHCRLISKLSRRTGQYIIMVICFSRTS